MEPVAQLERHARRDRDHLDTVRGDPNAQSLSLAQDQHGLAMGLGGGCARHDAAPCVVRSRKLGSSPSSVGSAAGDAGRPMRSRSSRKSPDSLMNLPLACSSDSRRPAFSLRRSSTSRRRLLFSISRRRASRSSSSLRARSRPASLALSGPISSRGGSGGPIWGDGSAPFARLALGGFCAGRLRALPSLPTRFSTGEISPVVSPLARALAIVL